MDKKTNEEIMNEKINNQIENPFRIARGDALMSPYLFDEIYGFYNDDIYQSYLSEYDIRA